jgi:hypothetical protein
MMRMMRRVIVENAMMMMMIKRLIMMSMRMEKDDDDEDYIDHDYPIHPSIYLFINLLFHPSIHPSIHPFIYPSTHRSIDHFTWTVGNRTMLHSGVFLHKPPRPDIIPVHHPVFYDLLMLCWVSHPGQCYSYIGLFVGISTLSCTGTLGMLSEA